MQSLSSEGRRKRQNLVVVCVVCPFKILLFACVVCHASKCYYNGVWSSMCHMWMFCSSHLCRRVFSSKWRLSNSYKRGKLNIICASCDWHRDFNPHPSHDPRNDSLTTHPPLVFLLLPSTRNHDVATKHSITLTHKSLCYPCHVVIIASFALAESKCREDASGRHV